jgi:anti-anti-sigma factor
VFTVVARGPALRRLAVAGEIDILTAPDLARFLGDHLDEAPSGATVTVDLSQVGLLSAVGIGVLVQAAKKSRRKGVRLVVDPVSPQVRRALQLSGTGPWGTTCMLGNEIGDASREDQRAGPGEPGRVSGA